VPRRVALRDTADGLRIAQAPVGGVKGLRRDGRKLDPRPIAAGDAPLDIEGTALEIVAESEPGDAEAFGLKVRKGRGEETVIGFNRRAGEVFVDRTHSGRTKFS